MRAAGGWLLSYYNIKKAAKYEKLVNIAREFAAYTFPA
jgi:hypothetical protein